MNLAFSTSDRTVTVPSPCACGPTMWVVDRPEDVAISVHQSSVVQIQIDYHLTTSPQDRLAASSKGLIVLIESSRLGCGGGEDMPCMHVGPWG